MRTKRVAGQQPSVSAAATGSAVIRAMATGSSSILRWELNWNPVGAPGASMRR